MNTRKLVTASTAALAAVALSVPVVHAQDAGSVADTDSVSELGGGSAAGDSGSIDQGSLEGVVPSVDEDATCVLPGLGGSVGKVYPLLGITGVPSIVVTLATSALDSFPNVLEVVAGEDGASELLGQTGSLAGPLCTTVLGGRLTTSTAPTTPTTPPQLTVIVDEDGNPISTVTPTPEVEEDEDEASSTPSSSPTTSVPTAGGSLGNIGADALNFGS